MDSLYSSKKLIITFCFLVFSIACLFSQITYNSTDIPKTIDENSANTVTSTLSVSDNINIGDINVSMDISHSYISDLQITLTSPDNTVVILYNYSCFDEDDIVMIVDDEGTATLLCPPIDGGNYQPSGNLSNFDNKSATGTWTLTINDGFDGDGGSLNAWSITIVEACLVTAPTLSKN